MTSLLLGDLNDYIQPSVACIKPEMVDTKKKLEEEIEEKVNIGINLQDCLACSGCITSAETILVTQQTHTLLAEAMKLKEKKVVASVCPSSKVALSRRYGLTLKQVHSRLKYFFTCHEVSMLEGGFCNRIAVRQTAEEFIERKTGGGKLPMLASECPGWVCYAEKKQPLMLPQMCRVRSPQQILGALAKSFLLPKFNATSREDIYFCTVMSCYDKKLEASRSDFTDENNNRDVDCVITTTELLTLIEEESGGNFVSLPEAICTVEDDVDYEMRVLEGSSAGGYLFYLMRHYALKVHGLKLADRLCEDPHVKVTLHRNNIDYVDYQLIIDEVTVLRFAAVYGFRNIQTFVQKAKTNKIEYDFVELMACPGACLFGGGQPKHEELVGKAAMDIFRRETEAIYDDRKDTVCNHDDQDEEVRDVYKWLHEDEERVSKILLTNYRPLEEVNKKLPLINVQW